MLVCWLLELVSRKLQAGRNLPPREAARLLAFHWGRLGARRPAFFRAQAGLDAPGDLAFFAEAFRDLRERSVCRVGRRRARAEDGVEFAGGRLQRFERGVHLRERGLAIDRLAVALLRGERGELVAHAEAQRVDELLDLDLLRGHRTVLVDARFD